MHLRLNKVLWKPANTTATEREFILHNAASTGNLVALKHIFALSSKLGSKFSAKALHQALDLAAEEGHYAAVDHILNKRMKYTFEARNFNPTASYPCALQTAAKNGRLEVLQLLLKHRYDVDNKAEALEVAVSNGHEQIVRVLLVNEDQGLLETFNLPSQSLILNEAIRIRAQSIVSLLLDRGVSVDGNTRHGCTPLMAAISRQWPWAVEELLSRGANPRRPHPRGGSVLHIAIRDHLYSNSNNLENVRLLLEHGCDLTHKDPFGQTPVATAIIHRHLEILHMMLGYGLTLSMVEDKDDLLALAANNGDKGLVIQLIQLGIDINALKLSLGHWPLPALHHAASNNQVDVMELLLDNGASLNPFFGSHLPSPLHIALERGHVQAAELLLEKGASLNQDPCLTYPWEAFASSKGIESTTLHLAAFGGMGTLDLVLRNGYNIVPWQRINLNSLWEVAINGRGSNDERVLRLVYDLGCDTRTGEYLDPVHPEQCLLEYVWEGNMTIAMVRVSHSLAGLDLAATNSNGQTLLHIAAMRECYMPIAEYLLKNGAPVNLLDNHQQKPIFYAAEALIPEVVRMLLAHGAELLLDEPRSSHPMWACIFEEYTSRDSSREPEEVALAAKKRYETLKVLIDHGADINMFCDGRTLLHDVILHESPVSETKRLVQLLLSFGADPSLFDSNGSTAIKFAEERGLHRGVDMLLRKVAGLEID